jgi:hypothetical protein
MINFQDMFVENFRFRIVHDEMTTKAYFSFISFQLVIAPNKICFKGLTVNFGSFGKLQTHDNWMASLAIQIPEYKT